MVLRSSEVMKQLREKQAAFEAFDKTKSDALRRYGAALLAASRQAGAELLAQLQRYGPSDRGAEPLEALDQPQCLWDNWVIPSGLAWQSREESHAWARSRLTGVAIFAVDGSQIYPSKDISLPVALVQIGWYENRHTPDGAYEKMVDVEVMTPTDLKVSSTGEPAEREVNKRRFQMETQRLIQYMEDRAGQGDCLVFFDGALVVTFADAFDEEMRRFYIDCVVRLLDASQRYRVPLVGYIDTTYARDLTVMLQRLDDLPDVPTINDAMLLRRWMNWGDRTPLFRCRRSGVLSQYPRGGDQIGFTYLKATQDGPPVRLEIPVWVQEAGLLDQVVDWVRGEIIIGGGYPYAIETADQTAVLQLGDRELFYGLLQKWAEAENLPLRLSRKMVSKARRR
jgi:hypothetical protein